MPELKVQATSIPHEAQIMRYLCFPKLTWVHEIFLARAIYSAYYSWHSGLKFMVMKLNNKWIHSQLVTTLEAANLCSKKKTKAANLGESLFVYFHPPIIHGVLEQRPSVILIKSFLLSHRYKTAHEKFYAFYGTPFIYHIRFVFIIGVIVRIPDTRYAQDRSRR